MVPQRCVLARLDSARVCTPEPSHDSRGTFSRLLRFLRFVFVSNEWQTNSNVAAKSGGGSPPTRCECPRRNSDGVDTRSYGSSLRLEVQCVPSRQLLQHGAPKSPQHQ